MTLSDKLSAGWPGAQWNWPNEAEYETLEWFGPGDRPSLAEIEAFEPAPSTDPADYPLLPWKFRTMVRVLGKHDAIMAAIDAIPDMWAREIARGRYLDATMYEFNDPLLQQMRAAVGMTEQELGDAWMLAKDMASA